MPIFPTSRRAAASPETRVRAAIDTHYDGVWRFLRRFGVAESDAEDAAQKVFVVFAEKLASIDPRAEKSFLFSSAVRIASDARKKHARSREDLASASEHVEPSDPAPSAEDQIDDRRRRQWLDQVLADLPDDNRAVLLLVDVEGHTMADASDVLGIPQGTVASRLRRARELFETGAMELKQRLQAKEARGES
ncbi:MAG: RNA polymerase sigma factor [Polyangiaceae bacterium]